MRVKIGDVWYIPEPGQPVMVHLTASERETISRMADDSLGLYACFHDADKTTAADMTAWMTDGMSLSVEMAAAPPDAEPIPALVYYNPDSDNFYDDDRCGKGQPFWNKWRPRAAEFPQSFDALKSWRLRDDEHP